MGLAALLVISAAEGQAEEFRIESAGLRFGLAGNESSGDFHKAEAFADWDLPWRWQFGSHWLLEPRLDLGAGWLGDSTRNAFIGEVGPLLVLTHDRIPVGVEAGSSPTVLSRYEFEDKNFGIPFQFTSHIGVFWDFATHFRLGYRFEHMSNAGLSSHNPGVNFHVFAVSYRF